MPKWRPILALLQLTVEYIHNYTNNQDRTELAPIVNDSPSKNLGITSHYLHSIHWLKLIFCFEWSILQDEGPDIVTKSVRMKMTLLCKKQIP